jgi:CRISPR system Cascade subunit CasE
MYLSRLMLNLRNRQVRMDLARPYEMHRTILQAFPDDLAKGVERVLYRVETDPRTGMPTLLVQSKLAPNWAQLPVGYLFAGQEQANPQVKEITLNFQAGQLLAFRLLANPTKRLSKSLPKGREESKRVGLYKPEEQLEWLACKGEAHGFKVVSAVPNRQPEVKDRQHLLTFLGVQFDGLLTVTAPEQLAETVINGIGSAKAFGCGLLSLAPAR